MKVDLKRLLVDTKQSLSMAEAKRYLISGIVYINDEIITPINAMGDEFEIKEGDILRVGKNREKIPITEELLKSLREYDI